MPRQRKRNPSDNTESVFLNIPYDDAFENLYLAYITGVSAFGLKPRAALEIPSSNRRLERILDLIQQCEYSVHDLSRVELDRTPPRTPRFNMPFELGLTVALEKIAIPGHAWVVCESVRLSKQSGEAGKGRNSVPSGRKAKISPSPICRQSKRPRQMPATSKVVP